MFGNVSLVNIFVGHVLVAAHYIKINLGRNLFFASVSVEGMQGRRYIDGLYCERSQLAFRRSLMTQAPLIPHLLIWRDLALSFFQSAIHCLRRTGQTDVRVDGLCGLPYALLGTSVEGRKVEKNV